MRLQEYMNTGGPSQVHIGNARSVKEDMAEMKESLKPVIQISSASCDCLVHENIEDHKKKECPVCNSEIELYWEPKYHGIRGRCAGCGTNWAES